MIAQPKRIKLLSSLVELGRFHPVIKHEGGSTLIGILVRDEEHVWATIPDEEETSADQRLIEDLLARARAAAKKI